MNVTELAEDAKAAIKSVQAAAEDVSQEVKDSNKAIISIQSSAEELDTTPAETGWFYRRWFTFISSLMVKGLLLLVIFKMTGSVDLKWVALALIGWAIVKDTLYMAGASVIDYAKLAASWKGNNKDEQLLMAGTSGNAAQNSAGGDKPTGD